MTKYQCEKCRQWGAMRFLSADLGRFVHLCAKCYAKSQGKSAVAS